MMIKDLEQYIVNAFCSLDTSPLEYADEDADYSHNYKYEMIIDLQRVFDMIKQKGITSLNAKPSECKFCFPKGKAYSFHHPITDEFIIRYVINQESDKVYNVEECRNNPIPEGKDGMPF